MVVFEHLDEGKDLIQSIMEAVDYTDYILDRRSLPPARHGSARQSHHRTIRETYAGTPSYRHALLVIYFEREYVKGCATDKLRTRRYADPEFNAVGAPSRRSRRHQYRRRRAYSDKPSCSTRRRGDRFRRPGLPDHLIVSDPPHVHSIISPSVGRGSVCRACQPRAAHMPNATEFAEIYLAAFRNRSSAHSRVSAPKRAFDNLSNTTLDPPKLRLPLAVRPARLAATPVERSPP
jgi:hypothetical protein